MLWIDRIETCCGLIGLRFEVIMRTQQTSKSSSLSITTRVEDAQTAFPRISRRFVSRILSISIRLNGKKDVSPKSGLCFLYASPSSASTSKRNCPICLRLTSPRLSHLKRLERTESSSLCSNSSSFIANNAIANRNKHLSPSSIITSHRRTTVVTGR